MIRYKKYQMTGENHPLKGLWSVVGCYIRIEMRKCGDISVSLLCKNQRIRDYDEF